MISIIIPTLDEERSLPGLLDAIQQQGAEHEVIVVDGGSKDRTREVARAHKVQTLVSHPGRGAAVCIGARESRGDVLLFLHADSTLLPEHWTKLAMCFRLIQRSLVGILDSFSTMIRPSADGLRDLRFDTVHWALLWRLGNLRSPIGLRGCGWIPPDTSV